MRTRNIEKEQLVKRKAVELLVKHGFENFSVNKLARECGISVATLYIYYKDKDDLIINIAKEEFNRMTDVVMNDFNPDLPFEEGLKFQWEKRSKYMLENRQSMLFFEQLKNSSYQEKIFESSIGGFKEKMGKFARNAVSNGEINSMPLEVFWSIAFAPLYTLIRFHYDGRSIGGKPFELTDDCMQQTFALVIKALRK